MDQIPSNTYVVEAYGLYIFISIALTVWVARTLSKNGLVFLVEAFHGNRELANSVNHLLVVGFYLINIGYVTLALKYGDKPLNQQQMIEFLSTKVGLVLVVLGLMHFNNMRMFNKLRNKAKLNGLRPPVTPQTWVPPASGFTPPAAPQPAR